MFEPPAGNDDFNADAKSAEAATSLESIERMEEEIARQKAELARRQDVDVIDSTGNTIQTQDEAEPVWPHDVITIQDKQVQVKRPPAAAIRYLGVFGFGEAGAGRGDFQDFMNRHVSAKSIADIKEWTYDGSIDEKFYDELLKEVVALGTGRPTGPSSSSRPSR
ncbi:hypothetical protein IU421_13345 [Nocardia cyriacigeorgica]|uniref:hypothetical protein n=1 Tax=Nocardia cyriacigeorgica TaxID=135487 RepID=UPI001894FB0B|nr:hypothetical protein [Nocardia cyriacigeorgica]MBF6515266.1 hypothetical protein [Nocardia cyriacigeorgica]